MSESDMSDWSGFFQIPATVSDNGATSETDIAPTSGRQVFVDWVTRRYMGEGILPHYQGAESLKYLARGQIDGGISPRGRRLEGPCQGADS